MSRNKLRRLEFLAGASPEKGPYGIASSKSKKLFDAELSRQAKSSIGGSSASGKREATRRTSAEQCSARELRGEACSSAQA
jgi:hypothetical protein